MKKQIAPLNNTARRIPKAILDPFLLPRNIRNSQLLGQFSILNINNEYISSIILERKICTSYIAIRNTVIAVFRTAWAEKATSFVATGII